MPQPYSRSELRALRSELDERWRLLPPSEAERWIGRWRTGASPYERVGKHAVRLQLQAIIALALRCGLRRAELVALTTFWMHSDNDVVIVWQPPGPWEGPHREVPYIDGAREPVRRWLEFRAYLAPTHDQPWLNLWSSATGTAPIGRDAFNRLLPTYLGAGWSLRRLRDTCAVSWLRAGLPLDHVLRLLGVESLEAVLPCARLVGGDLSRRMASAEARFDELLEASDGSCRRAALRR